MKLNLTNRSRGLTLTELLVVLLILGLLATIAIPVYTRRQEDARIRVAMSEAREIAMAEEQVAIVHGFYVPFQILDDLPPLQNGTFDTNSERINQNPDASSIRLIDPFVRAADANSGSSANNQVLLSQGINRNVVRASNLVYNWNGPFMNFQRFYYGSDPNLQPGTTQYNNSTIKYLDFPQDPWGNPYRFYSALGLIGSSAENFDPSSTSVNFSDGFITNRDSNRFDRYAVVSFGRDGISDTLSNNTQNTNDIFYIFGSDGVESTFGRNF